MILDREQGRVATEDPEPWPQTLAAGELVWAKTKGRHPHASTPPLSPPPATTVNPFLAAHDADALARANTGLAFVPHEFLAALGSVAVDEPTVRLLDRARLESWVRALAQGWGPNRPDRYRRRTKDELIDKIDIDMLADDGAASKEEEEKKERCMYTAFEGEDDKSKKALRREGNSTQGQVKRIDLDGKTPVPSVYPRYMGKKCYCYITAVCLGKREFHCVRFAEINEDSGGMKGTGDRKHGSKKKSNNM
ncbi:hypothetical protein TRIUR3_33297 [Triticum urartu]|uniref:Uncharacterized protein n=1 Tax=Triticum urartu TaxID=4572 RepID=M8A8T0_TRIUA|nr:hypothetical protein TRIUR3_33297 [Triticum urartu]